MPRDGHNFPKESASQNGGHLKGDRDDLPPPTEVLVITGTYVASREITFSMCDILQKNVTYCKYL